MYPRLKPLEISIYTSLIDYMTDFFYTANKKGGRVLVQSILNIAAITFAKNVVDGRYMRG
jgi:hypothetical protein